MEVQFRPAFLIEPHPAPGAHAFMGQAHRAARLDAAGRDAAGHARGETQQELRMIVSAMAEALPM